MNFFINTLAGALTGILSGFGVGGGTLLVLYMQNFTQITQHAAQGINLAYFIPTASASLVGHCKRGFVDKRAFVFTAVSGTVVTALTAWLSGSISPNLARRFFGVFLIFVGIHELAAKKKR